MYGQKHLIKCRCILPQFKNKIDPPTHQFIVFSTLDDEGNPIIKFSQCNNCGIIHKITDICTSEIIGGKEQLNSIVTIDDIRSTLNINLVGILEKNMADLSTWENVKFIIENKMWGQKITLSPESQDGLRMGKVLTIMGDSQFKVDSFAKEETI
jgi:hypothetical protein